MDEFDVAHAHDWLYLITTPLENKRSFGFVYVQMTLYRKISFNACNSTLRARNLSKDYVESIVCVFKLCKTMFLIF